MTFDFNAWIPNARNELGATGYIHAMSPEHAAHVQAEWQDECIAGLVACGVPMEAISIVHAWDASAVHVCYHGRTVYTFLTGPPSPWQEIGKLFK